MGRNLDLCYLAGAPHEVTCPNCNEETESWLDDKDMDCVELYDEEASTYFVQNITCSNCDHEFEKTFVLSCVEKK